MIRQGRFFLCTRPPHLDAFARGRTDFMVRDGVLLHDGPSLLGEMLAYLEQDEPLDSCRLCLGGLGKLFPHRQLTQLEIAAGREGRP
jgi:hypothetical protein